MVYEGNDKYIFVSYSHNDSEKVIPIIEALSDNGYRVWYDSGIQAGTEWPEYIEEHLINSDVVIVFMTPATVESRNCRNEINFALELKKEILVIYLEETTLLKGMRLQLNSTQSLFRNNHSSHESFIKELLNARILSSCCDNADIKEHIPEREPTVNHSTTRISNVCSIGTNDDNDIWPNGVYSSVLNRDETRIVFFHINLLKPIGVSGAVNFKKQIYNSENYLVYEDESDLVVESNYDKISTGWVLKGTDGSFIPSGQYRFVCSINNSPEFPYSFTVTDNSQSKPKSFLSKLADLLK